MIKMHQGSARHRSAPDSSGPRTAPRLAIVDSGTVTRDALPLLLTGFTVTGGFTSLDGLLDSRPSADIVLMDAIAPGGREAAAVHRLRRAGYLSCLYTAERRPAVLARYLGAGARGVISKTEPIDVLAGALRRIAAGETVVSASLTTSVSLPGLTERQLQVLVGRARGETFHSIAQRLGISVRTAQDHWTAIARRYEEFLSHYSAADLERSLGLDTGPAPLEPT